MKMLTAAIALAIAAFAGTSWPAYAVDATATQAVTSQSSDAAEGVVRKIDKGAKKITIKHGELKQLDMPPMTMVFQVKDPAMLDKVKVGDSITFMVEKIGGQFAVSEIEKRE